MNLSYTETQRICKKCQLTNKERECEITGRPCAVVESYLKKCGCPAKLPSIYLTEILGKDRVNPSEHPDKANRQLYNYACDSKKVSQRDRMIFALYATGHYTQEEIARQTDITQPRVSVILKKI